MHNQKNYFTLITYTNRGTAHLSMANTLESSAPTGRSPILYGPDYSFLDRHSLYVPPKLCSWLHKNKLSVALYQGYLNLGLRELETKINDLFTLATVRLDKLVIISTHFAVAQQIDKLKAKIEKTNDCRIHHIVVVTEDSFKKMWCIPNADIIFVPSIELKNEFLEHCDEKCSVEVLPYPIHPKLLKKLDEKSVAERKNISQKISRDIKVLHNFEVNNSFDYQFVNMVYGGYSGYNFTFVSESRHNFAKFAAKLSSEIDYSVLNTHTDSEDVTQYTRRIATEVFDIEITACDEKVFTSLLNPTQIGGMVQFITRPVSREHKDNYQFLERNGFVPSMTILNGMWKKAIEGKPPSKTMLNDAKKWRALLLPDSPRDASKFFNWAIRQNIVSQMMKNKNTKSVSNGAEVFWKNIEQFYIGEL